MGRPQIGIRAIFQRRRERQQRCSCGRSERNFGRSSRRNIDTNLQRSFSTVDVGGSRYEVNGGKIQGVWVFHRHGDRTPSAPLCHDEDITKESDFWKAKLPPTQLMKYLAAKFPLDMHPSWGNVHLDTKRDPYGALTMLGAAQMHRVGEKFFHRYGNASPFSTSMEEPAAMLQTRIVDNRAEEFLRDWHVTVYSTNYLRTITSARSFLDGLLYGKSNPHFQHIFKDLYKYGARLPKLFTHPHSHQCQHQFSNECSLETRKEISKILIHVREKQTDPLNAFDRNFQLMMQLIQDVVNQESFQERDASALSLAERLIQDLPGLQKRGVKFGGPSGINWIHAFDHFVCRSSHGMKLSDLSPMDETIVDSKSRNDNVCPGNVDPMQEYFDPTMTHLAWRFRQWYTSAPLLAEFSGPPLREVVSHAKFCSSSSSSLGEHHPAPKKPFVVYSCHDVSILSLLYGIQSDVVLADEENAYWPPYASTLVFELVQLDSDSQVMRILLNGEPARIQGIESNMLALDEFDKVVEEMIKAGGRELSVPLCHSFQNGTDKPTRSKNNRQHN